MSDYSELKRLVAHGSLPPIVSTLIAENEQLAEDYDKAWRHDLNDKNNYSALAAEVARLNADLEQAKLIGRISCNFDGYKAVLDESDQLKAENEALRKDAERYRYLRDCCGLVEYKRIAGSIGPGMLPSGERLDITVDAVMGRRAPHG